MAEKMTVQGEAWFGDMGSAYTDRNTLTAEGLDVLYHKRFGVTRWKLNEHFLQDVPKDTPILEVGCNIGMQLRHLQLMGFTDLQGIELQQYALDRLCVENVSLRQGSATELPYEDNAFDLVFTSGLLIHLPLEELIQATSEIARVARRWIWGLEYFSPEREPGKGHWKGLLWTDDYPWHFLYPSDVSPFLGLRMVRRWSEEYSNCDWVADMYLLEKQ